MSVPDVWRFRTGLPVVLALFSAIFWLLRQLKWRSRQQVAPYLLVSTLTWIATCRDSPDLIESPVRVLSREVIPDERRIHWVLLVSTAGGWLTNDSSVVCVAGAP